MKRLSFVQFFALSLQLFIASTARTEQLPSAQDVLASVRMRQSQQQIDLAGQLRESEIIIPFRLTQNGSVIRYSFENPAEVLQLQLGENGSRLDVVTDSGSEKIPALKLPQKIRGTGVTYED